MGHSTDCRMCTSCALRFRQYEDEANAFEGAMRAAVAALAAGRADEASRALLAALPGDAVQSVERREERP